MYRFIIDVVVTLSSEKVTKRKRGRKCLLDFKREREREREREEHHNMAQYIYIYIERERERKEAI